MKGKVSLAVVIPFFNEQLSPSQIIALKQWQKHLSKFDTYTVNPPNLKPPHPKIKTVTFLAENFTSVRSYSELLLTEKFYLAFEEYDYILIYQLDALVFSDNVENWTKKNLSYIGAPWFKTLIGSVSSGTLELRGGNGGLSLRSIPEALKVLKAVNAAPKFDFPTRWKQWAWFGVNCLLGQTKQKWLQCPAHQYPFNEDGFWSFEAAKYSDTFKPAAQKESLQFSFETQPRNCFQLNHQKLPFGTHAWEKYDKEFWQEKLNFLS